jgi:hypothetical protein
MKRLIIEIELGNDAMLNNKDVERCLLHSRMLAQTGTEEYETGEGGKLFDINGNSVGSWRVTETPV